MVVFIIDGFTDDAWILAQTYVLSKSVSCLVSVEYSHTVDHNFCSMVFPIHSEILVDIWWPIWSIYSLPKEQRGLYIPWFCVGCYVSFMDLRCEASSLNGFWLISSQEIWSIVPWFITCGFFSEKCFMSVFADTAAVAVLE